LMGQSPSDVDNCSTGQEFSNTLQKPMVRYRVHDIPP